MGKVKEMFWLIIYKVHQKEPQPYSVKQPGLAKVKQGDVEPLAPMKKCRRAVDATCTGKETAEKHQDHMSKMTNFQHLATKPQHTL